MLIKMMHMIFLPSLFLGTILACSSYSWVTAWVGLEINLMSFIPILINKLNSSSMETAIKYFLIQAMASMVIMIIVVINFMINTANMSIWSMEIISLSLALKAGMAPVHFWFPQIINELTWNQSFTLMTWQKIAPLIMLSYSLVWMSTPLIIISAFTGAIGGINQMLLKKLLAFSSIMNAAWLLTLSFTSMKMWWAFFTFYSIILASIINTCKMLIVKSINLISLIKHKFVFKMIIFLNIMSMAGLPPFAGFFIKLTALYHIFLMNNNLFIIMTLLISSVISFYFYLRMMYPMLLSTQFKPNQLKFKKISDKNLLNTSLSISLLVNLMIPILSSNI